MTIRSNNYFLFTNIYIFVKVYSINGNGLCNKKYGNTRELFQVTVNICGRSCLFPNLAFCSTYPTLLWFKSVAESWALVISVQYSVEVVFGSLMLL